MFNMFLIALLYAAWLPLFGETAKPATENLTFIKAYQRFGDHWLCVSQLPHVLRSSPENRFPGKRRGMLPLEFRIQHTRPVWAV